MSDVDIAYGKQVHAAARHTLMLMVRADVALRRSSLDGGVSDLAPSVLAVRRMATELRFLVTEEKRSSWVFGLFSDTAKDILADLHLRMEIGAVLETAPASSADAHLEFCPPPFFRPDPSGASTTVACHSGRNIRLTGRGRNLEITDETLNRKLGRRDAWPLESLVDLLDTLRAWVNSGENAEPVPFRPDPASKTGKLFYALSRGQTRLVGEIRGRGDDLFALRGSHPELREEALHLQRAHPDFVPRYEVQHLSTRSLVRWSEKGRLIRKGVGEAWLRGRMTARYLPDREPPVCRLTLTLPDAQAAGGPDFRAFLRSLTDRDRNRRIARLLRDEWSLPVETAYRFLERLDESRCLLLRVNAGDHDLVLLRGRRLKKDTSVLLGMKFEVEMEAGRLVVTPRFPAHLHTWSGEPDDRGIAYEHYPGYFFRLFKVLLRWLDANLGVAT